MSETLWAVIPAAGSGRRAAGAAPKQYQGLLGRTVLEWALAPILRCKQVAGIVIVTAQGDDRFQTLPSAVDPRIVRAEGGGERVHSVLNGIKALKAAPQDWVLVHDAARPCLDDGDLASLIARVRETDAGGLLAARVTDTLKRGNSDQRVIATEPRDGLYRALTPQMFRHAILERALSASVAAGEVVTDESQAVERLGLSPVLVEGRSDNIKVTFAEDLQHAEFILRQRFQR